MTERRLPPALEEIIEAALADALSAEEAEETVTRGLLDWLYGKDKGDNWEKFIPGLVERVLARSGYSTGVKGVGVESVIEALRAELGMEEA